MRALRDKTATGQRGAVAIEFMLVIGMLIAVFLLMLEYAVRSHAEQVATAAAEQGLEAASQYDGSTSRAQTVTNDYLTRLGPGLDHARVTATRSTRTASITVTGSVEQVIPFLPVHIRVHLEGPVEHFVQPSRATTP